MSNTPIISNNPNSVNFILAAVNLNTLERSFLVIEDGKVKFVTNPDQATRLPTPQDNSYALSLAKPLAKDTFDLYLCDTTNGFEVLERVYDGGWTIMNSTETLFGKLGVIVFWYYSGDQDPTHPKDALRLTKHLRAVAKGKWDNLNEHDLYLLHDALGSFPQRDKELDDIYEEASKRWGQAIKARKE